jgi:hypothetical protein
MPRNGQAYDNDTHFWLTYYLAIKTGYSPVQAAQIASADITVDLDRHTEPLLPLAASAVNNVSLIYLIVFDDRNKQDNPWLIGTRGFEWKSKFGVPKHPELEPNHFVASRDGCISQICSIGDLLRRIFPPSQYPFVDWNLGDVECDSFGDLTIV